MEKQEVLGIMRLVRNDKELLRAWKKLSPSARQMFREVDRKKRVPNILNDAMFKGVFDPEVRPEWLSQLVGSVIGREVRIIAPLTHEGKKRSVYSKGIIMDIPVRFLDAENDEEEIVDVEIQRKGINLPPKRSVIYSSDLVTRQYSAENGERKSEVNYDRVHPVHMIVIMEESPSFLRDQLSFQHHFKQISDTGIASSSEFELLQYYHFICLDVFRERRPHVAKLLENWMDFLSIKEVDEMMQFLSENPDFQPMYRRAIKMLADRKELLLMFHSILEDEDIAGSINLTNESIIKRLRKQVRKDKLSLAEKDREIKRVKRESGREMQRLIRENQKLKRQLAAK